ncbi:hypothetical protein [Actinoplanes regularis]|uniref:Uncharacterized protein n=1 Tax=Actinoplanes regularis TaxID=52697 RepID=A0A238ZV49_9ACTN|nr:hypothetical protein [Actinoplanes regularis]GIE90226.1 hypothetical protein Are01nite_67060 [Actinoplanes regularis]SNR87326.1 hypothetical protein SAMN06264365_106343 [Actinoplanes regularis]
MHERTVRNAFREAVESYCNQLSATGRDPRELRLSITVITTGTLSRETVEWIHRAAHDHVRNLLPGARVDSLEFPVKAGVGEPGHRFGFRHSATPAREDHGREHGAAAVLTLCYDRDFVWPCRIGAAARWLALGRLPGQRPGPEALPLPEYAAWLPRGPLLLVRNHQGRLDFARSTQRPRYGIRVDGVDLPLGRSLVAAAAGEIEYRDPDSVTVLRYRVDWEGQHV